MTAPAPIPDRVDTVVIGAGVAGAGAAALLTTGTDRSVMVLERAPFVGGRAVSFVGRGNVVVADGVEMGPTEFHKALAHARTFVAASTPSIEEIFERGLLDGYTIDAGGHGLFWGDRSRVACLLAHLGVAVPIPVNRGLAYVDGNRVHQVQPGQAYPWMSDTDYRATQQVLRDMASIRPEELAPLMSVSLGDWLAARDLPSAAYDYIKVLAASQTVMADPHMTPAGDFLGYMMTARPVGMNLLSGSVGTVAEPGPIQLVREMADVALEHGATIVTATTVTEVRVAKGSVCGVGLQLPDGTRRELRCREVVCTIPPKYVFNVLPPDAFPAEWVDLLRTQLWGAGLLSAVIGMRRDVWADLGIDERSFVFLPDILSEGFVGAVDMVMAVLGSWGRRNPKGRHDFCFSTALIDTEMRDRAKVREVIDWCEAWVRDTFDDWDRDQEFAIWTASPEAYGLWRPVGVDRPDVASPHVQGLYFAGDQYGARLWGGGVDGAALSAVLCVDQMTGCDLEEQIFPWYHRGLV
jgi:hypothetical protein